MDGAASAKQGIRTGHTCTHTDTTEGSYGRVSSNSQRLSRDKVAGHVATLSGK